MNNEFTIIGSFGISFASFIIFFLHSQWHAVSVKKIHKPDMDLKVIRPKSIMWNH